MKKAAKKRKRDDLRPEYEFDYSKARPNRFASRRPRGKVVAVVLDPDVARVFDSSKAVNHALRSVIAAMPSNRARKSRARHRKAS